MRRRRFAGRGPGPHVDRGALGRNRRHVATAPLVPKEEHMRRNVDQMVTSRDWVREFDRVPTEVMPEELVQALAARTRRAAPARAPAPAPAPAPAAVTRVLAP